MTDPIRFGRYELHLGKRRLTHDGDAVALAARAFDVLAVLDEFGDRIWWIELSAVTEPAMVARSVAQALDIDLFESAERVE